MSALKDIMNKMHALIDHLKHDLGRSERGNKAAAQRVRTGSIKFAKLSKDFRKISIKAEKSGEFNKHKEAVRKAKGGKKSTKKVAKKAVKKHVAKKAKKVAKKSGKKRK